MIRSAVAPGLVIAAMLAALLGSAPGLAASSGEGAPAATLEQATLTVGGNGRTRSISLDEIAALPPVTMQVSFKAEHGQRTGTFSGPLLWAVLQHAGLFDASAPRDRVRQVLRATGQDGYTAILALGELDPEFEGKQVILATTADGHALGIGHLRLVVPGDQRGGRSVRDVVRLSIE
jgi:hypothetical protein